MCEGYFTATPSISAFFTLVDSKGNILRNVLLALNSIYFYFRETSEISPQS